MVKIPKGQERESEIITFFYVIFGNRVHRGMDPDEARKEAYDAVSLRYDISKGRLLNIISAQKSSRIANNIVFKEKARALIDALDSMNQGLDSAKAKNEKLIALLKECVEDEYR